MKKFLKTVILLILLLQISTFCFAGQYMIDPGAFDATYGTDISDVKGLGQVILGYIVNIAAISSVVIIAILGLKFMLGSVEQRAEYKKSFMPLIIGVFVVLAASTIVQVVFDAAKPNNTTCTHFGQNDECSNGVYCQTCGEKVHTWTRTSATSQYIKYDCDYCEESYLERK